MQKPINQTSKSFPSSLIIGLLLSLPGLVLLIQTLIFISTHTADEVASNETGLALILWGPIALVGLIITVNGLQKKKNDNKALGQSNKLINFLTLIVSTVVVLIIGLLLGSVLAAF